MPRARGEHPKMPEPPSSPARRRHDVVAVVARTSLAAPLLRAAMLLTLLASAGATYPSPPLAPPSAPPVTITYLPTVWIARLTSVVVCLIVSRFILKAMPGGL